MPMQNLKPDEICKRMMFIDAADDKYDYGCWEAPGEGWTVTEWQQLANAVRNCDQVYWQIVDTFDFDLAPDKDWPIRLNELGCVVEDGYGDIIQWLAPELKQIDIARAWI